MPIALPPLVTIPFASGGDRTAIPDTSTADGFVNRTQGYTSDYDIDLTSGNTRAKAVDRPTQNELFFEGSSNDQWWQGYGLPPWFAAMPGGYDINAFVLRQQPDGSYKPYRSLVATNVSDPLTSPGSWEYVRTFTEVSAIVPMPAGGQNGAGAERVTVATDFNSFNVSGTWEFVSDAVTNASPNTPSSVAGVLESKQWVDGTSQTYIAQRFTAANGIVYTRGARAASSFSAWRTQYDSANAPIAMPAGGLGGLTAERVTIPTDFNTFSVSGAWEFVSDAVANASPNTPSALAGLLESKQWADASSQSYIMQRYTASDGTMYTRGARAASSLGNWRTQTDSANFPYWQMNGVTPVPAATTIAAAQFGSLVRITSATTVVTTLPPAAQLKAGSTSVFKNTTPVVQTITAQAGSQINGGTLGPVSSITLQGYDEVTLTFNGSGFDIVGGSYALAGNSGSFAATQAQFDRTQRIATTGYVLGVGAWYNSLPNIAPGALAPANAGAFLDLSTAGTYTLPLSTSMPIGSVYSVRANVVAATIAKQTSDTISVGSGTVASVALGQGDTAIFVCLGTSTGGTYWLLVGGSAQLRYSTSFRTITGATGYQNVGGSIIQYGSTGVIANGASLNVTFPIPFPTGATSIIVTGINSVNAYPTVVPLSAAQFQIRQWANDGSNYWYAIGY